MLAKLVDQRLYALRRLTDSGKHDHELTREFQFVDVHLGGGSMKMGG